jgi:hypothetical protein
MVSIFTPHCLDSSAIETVSAREDATRTCADGEACARRLPNRIVKTCLVLATILVALALGLDLVAPLFLNS